MSYCGACGGFYNPACPQWPQCAPAPNPHDTAPIEALVRDIIASAEAANRTTADRMYEALAETAGGCVNPKIIAQLALDARNKARDSNGENGCGNG